MTSTLFIVQIVLAILITIAVLLQKSSSIGLGAYSGSNESVFGAKGPAGFLTKMTFILGLLFVINTLALGYFYSQENKKSAVDTIKNEIPVPKAKTSVPAIPTQNTNKQENSKASETNSTKENVASTNSAKTTKQEENTTKQTTSTKESNTTK